jgi:hypothetical protein
MLCVTHARNDKIIKKFHRKTLKDGQTVEKLDNQLVFMYPIKTMYFKYRLFSLVTGDSMYLRNVCIYLPIYAAS